MAGPKLEQGRYEPLLVRNWPKDLPCMVSCEPHHVRVIVTHNTCLRTRNGPDRSATELMEDIWGHTRWSFERAQSFQSEVRPQK